MWFFTGAARSAREQFRHMWSDRRTRVAMIVVPIVLIIAALVPHARGISEDVMFAFDPTAERAYRYGTLHMTAKKPALYDIERAKTYLEASREIDPTYPAVNYHLARIYFIQGHYVRSLMSTNAEIMNSKDEALPEVYYMKGLIEGFIGHYDTAAADYRTYIELKPGGPNGWAPYNDLAWVLLKGGNAQEALDALNEGLEQYPTNAWLLVAKVAAQYEVGELENAMHTSKLAIDATDALTLEQVRAAYPGNDPKLGPKGLDTLRRSARENLQKIEAELATRR